MHRLSERVLPEAYAAAKKLCTGPGGYTLTHYEQFLWEMWLGASAAYPATLHAYIGCVCESCNTARLNHGPAAQPAALTAAMTRLRERYPKEIAQIYEALDPVLTPDDPALWEEWPSASE